MPAAYCSCNLRSVPLSHGLCKGLLPECPPRKRAVTFTAISPMQETNRARDRHTLATHRLSVLNAISEAKSVPAPLEPSKKSVFFDASTLKKKLKEDLCKDIGTWFLPHEM